MSRQTISLCPVLAVPGRQDPPKLNCGLNLLHSCLKIPETPGISRRSLKFTRVVNRTVPETAQKSRSAPGEIGSHPQSPCRSWVLAPHYAPGVAEISKNPNPDLPPSPLLLPHWSLQLLASPIPFEPCHFDEPDAAPSTLTDFAPSGQAASVAGEHDNCAHSQTTSWNARGQRADLGCDSPERYYYLSPARPQPPLR